MDLSQVGMLRKSEFLTEPGLPIFPMTASETRHATGAGWRKFAALCLAVAAVGVPVNEPFGFALLAVAAVVIFTGEVRTRPAAWLAACAIVAAAIAAQALLAPPRIEEGHNVFLPDAPALRSGLPADVYRHMAQEFDAQYPPDKRCRSGSVGCWIDNGRPTSPYAFSTDSIWRKSAASRAVIELDFVDPIWLRLGFINERVYNWTGDSDVRRDRRDRRFWMGLDRWRLMMPWYEMIRLPPAYVGGELCWRGELMWETLGGRFALWRGPGCRTIEPADAGARVFGIAIKPDTLAMRLTPPWQVRLLQWAQPALALAGLAGLLLMLLQLRRRHALLGLLLVGLSVAVIAADDASFLGGIRPFDGGDDGLVYDGLARDILQKLLAGDVYGFLEGGEKVFYYGGPGLRYFRAIEHIIFGESYLGYLALVLAMPFMVLALFRRFLPPDWSLALILLFVAMPVGTLFGTSLVQYEQWAGRGFADPAAYILFIAGMLPVVGTQPAGPRADFIPAFFGALLLALGIFMKPIVAPAAAVLLGGAGLAALYFRQWRRLFGLCIGFLPVFSMLLHNWVFGRALVLFSANSQDSNLLVMPPSAYAAAARDLITLNFTGGNLARVPVQLLDWLSGPSGSYAAAPLSAAGVVIVIYVVVRGQRFDPWLRLIGASALAQHAVALFYNAATPRYHFLTWFLTMVVVMVWLHQIGLVWFCRRYPDMCRRVAAHPVSLRLASGLTRLQKVTS